MTAILPVSSSPHNLDKTTVVVVNPIKDEAKHQLVESNSILLDYFNSSLVNETQVTGIH